MTEPTETPGLPVAGYKATQPDWAIALVNEMKEAEERMLRRLDALLCNIDVHPIDVRFLAIGRTDLQKAFMSINRAIFQPGRAALPEDN